MKMHQSTGILLLVLCASLSTDAAMNVLERHKLFMKNHVKGSMETCNNEMTKINSQQNTCKYKHTFIITSARGLVTSVCYSHLTSGVNLYTSTNTFKVVQCKHDRYSTYPNCNYNSETRQAFVVLACERNGNDRLPVHYQRDLDRLG